MSLGPSLSLPHSHLSLFPIFSGLWTHCNCRWFSSCIQERWRKTLPLISSLQFVIPRLGELLLLLLSHSVVSNSVRLQRRQPTRLLCPRDSPGKNTGVGCHILLRCMKVKSEREVVQLCPTLSDPMDCSPPDFSIHGIFQARVLEWGAIAFSTAL